VYNTLSCLLLFTSSTSILLPSQILFLFFCHTIPFFYGWMLPVYFNTQRPIHGLCPLHLLHLVDLEQFMYPLLIIQLFDCGSCRLIHMVPIPTTPKPCRLPLLLPTYLAYISDRIYFYMFSYAQFHGVSQFTRASMFHSNICLFSFRKMTQHWRATLHT